MKSVDFTVEIHTKSEDFTEDFMDLMKYEDLWIQLRIYVRTTQHTH